MGHIFISYSHKDKDYVHKLQEAIQNEGFEVWIDDRIDYGKVWPLVIQEQLDASDALILIMTPHSFESLWVQNELERARQKKKPIFPLLLEGDVWLSVQTLQYVDVRDKRLPLRDFYENLTRVTPRRKIISEQVSEQERERLMTLMQFVDEKDKLTEALLQDYWEQLGNILDDYYIKGVPSSELEAIEKHVLKIEKMLNIDGGHMVGGGSLSKVKSKPVPKIFESPPPSSKSEEQQYHILLAKLEGNYKVVEAMITNEQRRYQTLTREQAIERIIKRVERYKQ